MHLALTALFHVCRNEIPNMNASARLSTFFMSASVLAPALAQVPVHQSVVHNTTGSTTSVVNGVAVSGAGELIITGWRTDALVFGGTSHPQGSGAIFLAKFDAQGNELWSKVSGSTDILGNHKGMSVAVDGAGNVYIAGQLFAPEAATFDGTILPSGASGFVAKYSEAGVLLWVKDFPAGVYSITVDGTGNPFINQGDNLIAKLDQANGNALASVSAAGDLMNVLYHNITVDASNNIIAQWGSRITKYDNSLTELWSTPITKSFGAETYRISVASDGDIWATFYAAFGTVTLGGTDYTNFPAGYFYQLDAATGGVLACLSPGAFKLKKFFTLPSGGPGFIASGDFAFNAANVVKYDAQLVQVWAVPTFTTNDMALIADDCFALGGAHTADITLDGTVYSRPNGSGRRTPSPLTCARVMSAQKSRSRRPHSSYGRILRTQRCSSPAVADLYTSSMPRAPSCGWAG